jgi:glycyl-tRNA synthetase
LAQQDIILDPDQRKATIRQQVAALMRQAGGDEIIDEALLDEVAQLVEAPTALKGTFDQDHLQLPPEVLVSVMKKHQRYFPVSLGDQLQPYFITVRNGDGQHLDVVADGNEQVIRARFSDAAFFIHEDVKHRLEDFLPRLDTLLFQKKLGSMLSKSRRIMRLVEPLAGIFGLDASETATAHRAAELCKADLVTHMVVEMTSLQGIMGRYYALHSGEPADVAQAIFEHYLPRAAGDRAPSTRPGLVVGLADRLDTLAGLFAAGLAPSGTKDPFAQRRAALGLVQSLISWNLAFDLRAGLELAARELPMDAAPESLAACLEFVVARLRGLLIEQGSRYDVVDAVLAAQRHNPAGVFNGVRALSAWVSRADWNTILPAYARCVRITRDQSVRHNVEPSLLVEPAELALLASLHTAEVTPRQSGSVDDFLTAFVPMIPAINRFFDEIMVMVDDSRLRSTRLGLLQRIAALADGTVDLSVLEGF